MPDYGEPLTERETELLRLMATGVTNREIAYRLNISVNTVKVHVRNIFRKIGAESRTEATIIAVREGWVPVDSARSAPGEESEAEEAGIPAAPPLSPLPWPKRIALVIAALLVVAVMGATWPGSQQQTDARLDPPPDQLPEQRTSAFVRSPESRWHERAQMPTRRAYLALAAAEGRLLAIGGRTEEGITAAVELYDPGDDIWARGKDKPVPVAYVSAAVVGTDVYVPGGCDVAFKPTSVVEVYDIQANSWRTASPLPEPRCAYALATHDEMIYLFGGRDEDRYVSTVFVYHPTTDTWAQSAPMSTERGFAAAAALDGHLYVVGGHDGERELTTCARYEPARETWKQCAPLTVGRGGLGLVSLANQLYAIGGGGWTSYLGFNEGFDAAKGAWRAIETPLVGEWRSPGVARLDNTIYCVGGWSARYLGLNQAYDPLPFRMFMPVSKQQ